MLLTSENIITIFNKFNWKLEDFNLIGIRSNLQVPDTFNDLIGCMFKVPELPNISILELQKYLNIFQLNNIQIKEDGINGKETSNAISLYQSKIGTYHLLLFNGTTIPGIYWLKNYESKLGTAVLEGDKQFKYIWKIGYHKQKENHEAFVQISKCEVLRDFNHNDIAGDTNRKETGIFGINMHRANINGKSIKIGQWSAGCQVFDEKRNLDKVIKIAKFYYKNGPFNYTLINEKTI